MTSSRSALLTNGQGPDDWRAGQTSVRKGGAAQLGAPLITSLIGGDLPLRFEFFDGSAIGPSDGPGVIRVRSKDALRRVLWAPSEIGLARAFVSGDIDIDGDLGDVLRALGDGPELRRRRVGLSSIVPMLRAAIAVRALRPPPPPPKEELRAFGRRHSKARDEKVVRHHYDVGNDFYRTVLGPSLVYSCARFDDEEATLEQAQSSKLDLSCKKLGLGEGAGMRLLDVGCGWGSMALHAASRYGAEVVGITLSPEQAELARDRVKEAGLDDRVDIRLQDYRDVSGETFDAISSIGMFEHVGKKNMDEYFSDLFGLLKTRGRLLNHAISKHGGSRINGGSFIGRYVFPDGELIDVGEVVLGMERAGFDVRDVESLREHYARTLRCWVKNLEGDWATALHEVGEARARVWRLYMSASANRFADGRLSVHQVLGIKKSPDGSSGAPPTRGAWT